MSAHLLANVLILVNVICVITGTVYGWLVVTPRRKRGERFAGPMALALGLISLGLIAAIVNLIVDSQ
jgi:hypothetical protein